MHTESSLYLFNASWDKVSVFPHFLNTDLSKVRSENIENRPFNNNNKQTSNKFYVPIIFNDCPISLTNENEKIFKFLIDLSVKNCDFSAYS